MKTELLRLMKKRRSIRKYKEDHISLELICQILEAGRYAPSGANVQPWIYVVVTDNKLKEKIRIEAEKIERNFHKRVPTQFKKWLREHKISAKKSFLTEAPALVVVASLTKAPYWLESTWISIAYVLLSVESHNLGSLTYTPSTTAFLNKLLNIPDDYRPVAILPLGHPAESPSPKSRARKPSEQVIYFNRYNDNPQTRVHT